jgi:hypothetical protein
MRFSLFSGTKRIVTNEILRSNAKQFGDVFSLPAQDLGEQIGHYF